LAAVNSCARISTSEFRLAIIADIFTSANVIQESSSRSAIAARALPREATLYAPVKGFLERRGYEVKGEVRGCDLVACRGDEPPVVVELKLRFSLALVLQGIDRLALTERVYLAVPRRPSHRRRSRGLAPDSPDIRKLCRRLGLGLMLVGRRTVDILEEPLPYRPRPAKARALRLKDEFDRRIGDANVGGTAGLPVVTAYRQDALRCARALAVCGPMRIAALRAAAGVPGAARILQRNVYGWFTRLQRGTYTLSEGGGRALTRFAVAMAALPMAPVPFQSCPVAA
jgi:hypothetical protein